MAAIVNPVEVFFKLTILSNNGNDVLASRRDYYHLFAPDGKHRLFIPYIRTAFLP
jgi:hypothetical protein